MGRRKIMHMLRIGYLILILLLALSLVAGCVSAQNSINPGSNADTTPQVQDPEDNNIYTDMIQKQIDNMSLDEKIGQLIIAGIDGYENDEYSRQLIEKYHVGGFVLFKRNIEDAEQMLELVNSLKENNSSVNSIPLFLSIDEEGGRISRMPEEFMRIPTSKSIGRLNNNKLTYKIGSILGRELKAFGLNMNFAPVLDVNSNPENPVIGDRAFGDDPNTVSEHGIQAMRGIQSQNIISVVKHFPGHGDTSEDSHFGLPSVNNDMERLNSFELVPFSAVIKNNADAIMIAHILLTEIDPDNPATLSSTVISGMLREDMGFGGIVITDDMTMGAILNNYDIGEAAVKSINAGSDMILVCHGFDKQKAVLNAVRDAVEKGDISVKRINESVYRILKLKQKYSLSDVIIESVQPQTIENINDEIKGLYNEYPSLKG
jgi:beta-N-acetylhexosaminidase